MIFYSRGSSYRDNRPEQREAADFDEFAELVLSDRSDAKGKTYVCAAMAEGKHADREKHPQIAHWRSKQLVLPRAFLPFDCDGFDTPQTFSQLLALLERYQGFAYTTASHTPDAPRCRVVLAQSRATDRAEGQALAAAVQAQIARELGADRIKFDTSVYRAEQPLFTPLHSAQAYRFVGAPVDVEAVFAAATRVAQPARQPADDSEIIEGERNNALTRLAGKLRRNGLSADALDVALQAENMLRCAPPLDTAEVSQIAHSVGHYPTGDELLPNLLATIDTAIAKTLAGDPGVLFEHVNALRDLRADFPADYARVRARIKSECRRVSLTDLERQLRRTDAPADDQSPADLLVEMASRNCELFHDRDADTYALIEVDGHRECWPVDSKGFREWLAYRFYREHGRAPAETTMNTAISTIEGNAKFGGDERQTHLRVASAGDAVWIDLCDDQWRAVEVTATGWRAVERPPMLFTRSSTMRPLPMPMAGGSIEPLWSIVNVREADRLMVLVWMLECFRTSTPYAVLELTGEHGSAKSSTQHYLRELIDPNRANNRTAPKTVEDVFIAARNSHLVSFENLSHLAAPYQDALCTLATGTGFATRTFYTNTEETVVNVKRPVALNGIAVVVTAQDLSDRTLHIDLPTIETRATANQLEQDFADHRSSIFGGVLDLLARALGELQTVRAEPLKLPRMADFAQLGEAMYRASGMAPGSFLADYAARRGESVQRTLETSPVAAALLTYLEGNPQGFNGTFQQLYDALVMFAPTRDDWPRSVKGLADALRRLAPALRQIGIFVTGLSRAERTRSKHGNVCTVRRADTPIFSFEGDG